MFRYHYPLLNTAAHNKASAEDAVLHTPETASDITLKWIRSVLHCKSPGCTPVSIEVDPDFGGPSLLGKIARVTLRYPVPECEPSSIIVKFQGSDWEGRIYQLLLDAEVRSVPKLLGAFENGTLILEDLSPAQPGPQTGSCSVEQAQEVLELLADIHGRFWGGPRTGGPRTGGPRTGGARVPSRPEQFAGAIDYNMSQCWEPFKRRYREILGTAAVEFEWAWQNSKLVAAHRLSEPATLFHGDVHSENLLFSDDGESGPILIDWQLSERGLAANDISFFFSKSLTVNDRRTHEERLLRYYFDMLPESIRGEYKYSRFYLDYRACVARSMVSAVMLVGPRFADRPDRFELADTLATRVISAVRDLKPMDAFQELGAPNT